VIERLKQGPIRVRHVQVVGGETYDSTFRAQELPAGTRLDTEILFDGRWVYVWKRTRGIFLQIAADRCVIRHYEKDIGI
jgi:hypothetical protein